MKHFVHFFVIVLGVLVVSCGTKDTSTNDLDIESLTKATPEQVESLIEQFVEATDGAEIVIPEGFYELDRQLIIDRVSNVTVKGAGMLKTVLSFKTMTTGGEGLKISGNNLVFEDFAVIDAPGDDIKAQSCDGIVFRRIITTWTHGDKSQNGTYGLYPVQCKNVLIEYCEVSHSRDAGIYVGQSENIIVRNNYVHQNVAGIEIENSDNAEVYDNHAENNTGGILVFNLPGLPKAFGSGTKIYNNLVKANNHANFAIFQDGNPISMIPPGSGIVLLAADNVEIYNNNIEANKTLGIAVAGYFITGLPIPDYEGWSPYTTNIYIHDNTYVRSMSIPDITKDWGKLITTKLIKAPDILYDGIYDKDRKNSNKDNPMDIYINEDPEMIRFFRMAIPDDGNMLGIEMHKDVETFAGAMEIHTNVENVGKF